MSEVFRRMDIAKLQFCVYVGGDIGGVGVLKEKRAATIRLQHPIETYQALDQAFCDA